MARNISVAHAFARESHARLVIGPLGEISIVVLLVGLTWFLIAI